MADQYDGIRKILQKALSNLHGDLSPLLRELHGEQAKLSKLYLSPVEVFEIGSSKSRIVGFEIEMKASIGDVEITQKRGF